VVVQGIELPGVAKIDGQTDRFFKARWNPSRQRYNLPTFFNKGAGCGIANKPRGSGDEDFFMPIPLVL
jgi:hypothetical protein